MKHKMSKQERMHRRFTEAFRKEQVELIEKGEATQADIARRYDVSYQNVHRWVKRYGKLDRENKTTYVGSSKDFDRLRLIEKEYKSLQRLFGEQQIELIRARKLLDIAKEQLGSDFEKKTESNS